MQRLRSGASDCSQQAPEDDADAFAPGVGDASLTQLGQLVDGRRFGVLRGADGTVENLGATRSGRLGHAGRRSLCGGAQDRQHGAFHGRSNSLVGAFGRAL